MGLFSPPGFPRPTNSFDEEIRRRAYPTQQDIAREATQSQEMHMQALAAQAQQDAQRRAIEPGQPIPSNTEAMRANTTMTSSYVNLLMEAEIFGDRESLPKKKFKKRLEKYRKKHPEDFQALQKLHKKAYKNDKT